VRGAGWLGSATSAEDLLTPESLGDDHRLVAKTAAQFAAQEVAPALTDLERKDWSVARRLLVRAGELGLLGTDVPEAEGGVGLDKAAAVVVAEALGGESSFAMAFGAQTGLAILPILGFGTDAQRAKYLPPLLSGRTVGAYCLSESGSGSDALSARTRATELPDGTWQLRGEKLWITNGAFADIFIVFAKADGDRFSAFIVERAFGGVTNGAEEHKLGLHGSSTTPVLFEDVRVPAANVLGAIGQGHRVAFNVLNYGRFKLAATASGATKAAIAAAAQYATTRQQFGKPIAAFGAIRHKLAEMTIREYAVESMLYRTAGLMDARLGAGADPTTGVAAVLEEFAVEASLLKTAASESLDYATDELVQIHGGNGYVRDYAAERRYRDARPNRIFEGTNEINRVLVPGLIVKRARQGRLDLRRGPREAMRDAVLLVLKVAIDRYGDALSDEQEVAMLLCDMLIDVFAVESARLRAAAASRSDAARAALHHDVAVVLAQDAAHRVTTAGRTALSAMLAGNALETALREFTVNGLPPALVNTVAARRRIADVVIERRGYAF
jgi:alkylation response protein AidB-like acyl-CoA dehydrogenase